MIVEVVIKRRGEYDSGGGDDIDNDIKGEHREGFETGRRQKHVKKRIMIKLNDDNIKKTLIDAFIKKNNNYDSQNHRKHAF